jgi:Protein of unknown function (DUF3592)
VNSFHRPIVPRFQNDGKSWHSLWKPVPFLLFCIAFFGYRAAVENDSASRQQTSFGTIAQCEQRGRGNENYCHYTFPVGDEQYTSVNKAEPGVGFGQSVVVYYDRQDPRVNALEDFSEQSGKNKRFVYILLLVLAAILAFIVWDRAPYRETSDERTH